jgi:hypothetical protein
MADLEPGLVEDKEITAVEAPPPKPSAEMTPEEALEFLRKGETLKNVRVVRLRLEGEFPLPLRLRDVVLVQPQFEGPSFLAEVAMTHCTIDRPRFNNKTRFAKGLDLRESFLNKANLHHLTVQGPLACDHMQTRGKFLLANSVFEGTVRFWETRFKGWVDISQCAFKAPADFRSFHAEEGFSLNRCTFAAEALFRGSTVAKKLDFTTSRFEGLLDFSKAKLFDYVYLESIQQGDKQRFAFLNTLGEKILIGIDQLKGRLASEEKGDYKSAMHEYGFLKRAFAALYRHQQEDWAFYRFKVNERRGVARSWDRPMSKVAQFCSWFFLDLGCSYGTSPRRAVRAALTIIFFFALMYALGMEQFGTVRPPFDGPPNSPLNRLMMGIITSVAVFSSGFAGLRELAHGWIMFPLIIEALLGTLLWGLFIVAFSRKVIR